MIRMSSGYWETNESLILNNIQQTTRNTTHDAGSKEFAQMIRQAATVLQHLKYRFDVFIRYTQCTTFMNTKIRKTTKRFHPIQDAIQNEKTLNCFPGEQ